MYRKRKPILIEKGIPIPNGHGRGGAGILSEAIATLTPGDSFLLKTEGERIYALNRAKKLQIPIITRKMEKGGFRVWRVK